MKSRSYPIGPYVEKEATPELFSKWLEAIEHFPSLLKTTVENLTEEQLDTPYRPNGWTVRQVVHHVADSHINSYIRTKLALTEEKPVIKPYAEELWAELADSALPVEHSLALIDALHARWTALFRSLSEQELKKIYLHPDNGPTSIAQTAGLYSWHGQHHLAHIQLVAGERHD